MSLSGEIVKLKKLSLFALFSARGREGRTSEAMFG